MVILKEDVLEIVKDNEVLTPRSQSTAAEPSQARW